MSLLQAQLLLNMSSLEPVNFGVQQNNSEAFTVALCHLAELHAEQVRPQPRPLTARCPGQVTIRPVCLFLSVAGPLRRCLRDPAAPDQAVPSSLQPRQGEAPPTSHLLPPPSTHKRVLITTLLAPPPTTAVDAVRPEDPV